MSEPVVITDVARYVGESPLPVAVDFWAPWCRPCHAVAPHLAALAAAYAGRLTVAKLNVDDHPEQMALFGVLGLPTIVLFSAGKEVGRVVGARPRREIEAAVAAAVASGDRA